MQIFHSLLRYFCFNFICMQSSSCHPIFSSIGLVLQISKS